MLANVFFFTFLYLCLFVSFLFFSAMSPIISHSFCECVWNTMFLSLIHSLPRNVLQLFRISCSTSVFMSLDIIVKCFPNGCVPCDSIASDAHQFSIHFVYHFYCLLIEHHIAGRLATAFLPSRVWQFSSFDIEMASDKNRYLNHWTFSTFLAELQCMFIDEYCSQHSTTTLTISLVCVLCADAS